MVQRYKTWKASHFPGCSAGGSELISWEFWFRRREAARNIGAQKASGEIILFLDDDLEVSPTFLEAHLRAHDEWPGALVAGSVLLPRESLALPFVRESALFMVLSVVAEFSRAIGVVAASARLAEEDDDSRVSRGVATAACRGQPTKRIQSLAKL